MNAMSVALTIVHHVIPFTIGKAVAVLDGDNRNNFASTLDMFAGNVRQSDQPNLSFVSQFGQRFNRSLKRHDRIGCVQLINIDAVQSQSLEAAFDRFAQVGGSCSRASIDLVLGDSSRPWLR